MKNDMLDRKIEKLYEVLQSSIVAVFGAGTYGAIYIDLLERAHIRVEELWDNVEGKQIDKKEHYISRKPYFKEGIVVILAISINYDDVLHQLIQLGYSLEKIILYKELDILNPEFPEPLH